MNQTIKIKDNTIVVAINHKEQIYAKAINLTQIEDGRRHKLIPYFLRLIKSLFGFMHTKGLINTTYFQDDDFEAKTKEEIRHYLPHARHVEGAKFEKGEVVKIKVGLEIAFMEQYEDKMIYHIISPMDGKHIMLLEGDLEKQ